MRQRYYNPDIKRFINRDVVRGTLGNSQSLNRYSYVQGNPISLTDPFGLSPLSNLPSLGTIVHTVLNVVGCVPGPIGTAADLANAAVYAFVDKDYGNALQCVMSGVMSGISDVASAISKTSKTANYIATTANIISNVTVFGMNAEMAVDMGVTMWDEYVVKDEKFSLGTLGEIAVLGFSLLGMKNSAKGALDSAKNLANMMKQDNVAGKIKESLTNFANDNRGCIGGDAYGGKSGSESGSTTADIYSFGNKSAPRGARPDKDFGVENFDSIVGPESGPLPKGASNFLDANTAPLNGHYHRLPAGTQMPDGLDIIADGIDVMPNSPHGVGHYTIFPTRAMTVNEFNDLYKSLPWQYGG